MRLVSIFPCLFHFSFSFPPLSRSPFPFLPSSRSRAVQPEGRSGLRRRRAPPDLGRRVRAAAGRRARAAHPHSSSSRLPTRPIRRSLAVRRWLPPPSPSPRRRPPPSPPGPRCLEGERIRGEIKWLPRGDHEEELWPCYDGPCSGCCSFCGSANGSTRPNSFRSLLKQIKMT
ncbi:hypothetical protein PVAP13_3NG213400 [Panicum virgatum]|uniref:Uncharacterized protein n=1 Tax=Panicum virgatum TaxID=38727 RepID=A0A8T0UDI6_PANVG|nr:hypothetical protein PVAP13_3NG213400 [Panicum virgatum]